MQAPRTRSRWAQVTGWGPRPVQPALWPRRSLHGPGRPPLPRSLLCTTGCEPALQTPHRETRRPGSTPPISGPAPLRASASARDSRGGWAPMCPVEVAEEHPPTRPCAGRLRSWHRADLAEGPSLPQLSPPDGHRRSKSGWGGESWSRGPSHRTPRGHAGLLSWPSRRPEGGLHSHVFLGKALGVPGRRAWPPSPQSSDRPGVPLGRRVPRGTHLSPDSSRREADVGGQRRGEEAQRTWRKETW